MGGIWSAAGWDDSRACFSLWIYYLCSGPFKSTQSGPGALCGEFILTHRLLLPIQHFPTKSQFIALLLLPSSPSKCDVFGGLTSRIISCLQPSVIFLLSCITQWHFTLNSCIQVLVVVFFTNWQLLVCRFLSILSELFVFGISGNRESYYALTPPSPPPPRYSYCYPTRISHGNEYLNIL